MSELHVSDYARGLEDAARLMEEHCGWLPGKTPDANMRYASHADYAAAIRALAPPPQDKP